ncbi:uncharacterized protein LOC142325705 [Lycorma delicatula]|uniref:uncharacterized protein LOC142325705 n=1 Tax=Lycorma delicatula TaxID=130591 RepID=UPI003F510781
MRSEDILQFHGFDKDELLLHSEVKDCKRKLVITVKLNNCGSTMTEEEFIVVDHVYDPVVHKRSRLLNPLVFKLKQEQVLQLYGLTYANTINAEAREDVLNKNMPNYTGCDTTSSKPTCGMSYIKDKVIPFTCPIKKKQLKTRNLTGKEWLFKDLLNIREQVGENGPVDIKKTPDFTSFKSNKEFLGKGLWGSLYDSDVTDLKLKRKERSLDESRSSELTKYYENENLYIDSPNDLLKISKEGLVCDKNVHENEKPKFIPTNHKFSLQSVIEMFKLKNKTKPYSQVQYHCLYPHLEHFDNPPLETAKGFLKSDINTSCRKSQSPWDVNLSDSPIQTNCGKKKSSDRKYVHILSKLIEQGIDPENDLHLTREDIIKKFKQPVKKNRYIKSVIHKARKNLRNKKYRNGPQRADRFDSYHFRKDNKQNRLFIKTNAKQSIEFDNNEQTILQNDSEDLNYTCKPDTQSPEELINHIHTKTITEQATNDFSPNHAVKYLNDVGTTNDVKGLKTQPTDNSYTTSDNYLISSYSNEQSNSFYGKDLKYSEEFHISTQIIISKNFADTIEEFINVTDNEDIIYKPVSKLTNKEISPVTAKTNHKNMKKSNEKLRKKPKDNKSKTKKKKVKRQILSSGVQFRGGQSCIDRSVPSFADPVTYHESAHCLRFSDLWYTVYKLKHPFIEHSVHIQLYEKHNYQDGRTYWHEVTKGMTVNIGTFVKHVQDYLPTISFTYIPFTDENSGVFCLDPSKTTLLVPQPLPPSKAAEYPQVEAGPKEYLLVRDDEISVDGEECDKAGVSFEAFAKQPDRCAKPRGSCLNNQPLHMWMHDMEAKRNNKPGKYFLENYASIPQNPFKMNESTKEEYLALDYAGQFTSAIEVEVRSDLNAIVRTGAAGQLTEIYIDSTCDFHTRITVIVTNLGLASSAYFPRLSNCPVEVPDVWTHNEGPLADIAPQHRHIYRMSLYGALPVDRFHCSIELLNEKRELVATRRIRVQRQDRCLCQWHCLCACIGSVDGLRCIPMSAEHYHAAGFQGSLPVVTYAGMETEGSWTWHLYNMFLIYAATFLNILLLGLIKAFLGFCCCSQVGSWGLWLIFPGKAKELEDYKEPDIAHFPVIFDVAGYAVHPITGVRNVRFLSKSGEFCINLLFFAAAPIAIVIKLMKICCPCFRSEPNQWDDIGQPSGVEEEPLLPETNEKIDKKKEEIIKAKKQKLLLGSDKTDSGSNWSLPSDLEIDENDVDTEYVLQERYASQKNLQQNRRSRGGADIPSPRSGIYGFLKDSFTDTKNFRDNLSELEKEMAEHLVDTLQEAYIVYRNLRNPCGGVKLQPGTSYCVKGFFTKSGSTFKFTPPPPLLQYWTEDNKPITPPCTLSISDFEVEFKTAEEVLLGNEISVLPRGVVINVWHSLDSMQQTEPF